MRFIWDNKYCRCAQFIFIWMKRSSSHASRSRNYEIKWQMLRPQQQHPRSILPIIFDTQNNLCWLRILFERQRKKKALQKSCIWIIEIAAVWMNSLSMRQLCGARALTNSFKWINRQYKQIKWTADANIAFVVVWFCLLDNTAYLFAAWIWLSINS